MANVQVQEELCAKMEALIPLAETDPEKSSNEMRTLQERWKPVAAAPRSQAETLWTRFKAAQEQVYDNRLAVTWFGGGLRMIDIANPWRPEELGYYIPEPGQGHQVAQSNDVFATRDGLYYLVDRLGGFDILEWIGA